MLRRLFRRNRMLGSQHEITVDGHNYEVYKFREPYIVVHPLLRQTALAFNKGQGHRLQRILYRLNGGKEQFWNLFDHLVERFSIAPAFVMLIVQGVASVFKKSRELELIKLIDDSNFMLLAQVFQLEVINDENHENFYQFLLFVYKDGKLRPFFVMSSTGILANDLRQIRNEEVIDVERMGVRIPGVDEDQEELGFRMLKMWLSNKEIPNI